jgi:hypothetical protein
LAEGVRGALEKSFTWLPELKQKFQLFPLDETFVSSGETLVSLAGNKSFMLMELPSGRRGTKAESYFIIHKFLLSLPDISCP